MTSNRKLSIMEKSIKDSKPGPKTWLLGTSWHGTKFSQSLDVLRMDVSTRIFPAFVCWCFDINLLTDFLLLSM